MSYKRLFVRLLIIGLGILTVIHIVGMHPERAWWAIFSLYICIPLATLSLNKNNQQIMRIIGSVIAIALVALGR